MAEAKFNNTVTPSLRPYRVDCWQDTNQYPKIKGTSPEQWAWEFLRRSSNYAKHLVNAHITSENFRKRTKRQWKFVSPFLPRGLHESESLDPWHCYPIAEPQDMTVAEFKKKHGKRPILGYRRDMLAMQHFCIKSLIPQETDYSSGSIKFKLRKYHAATLEIPLIHRPHKINLLVAPFELPVVFDLTMPLKDQFQQIEESVERHITPADMSARFLKKRKITKHSLKLTERWAMLRYADAIRAHQEKSGSNPKKIDQTEFLCDGFKFQDFIDVIRADTKAQCGIGSSEAGWADPTLKKAQLQNWQKDHLYRLINQRGYLALLRRD
jgi:hypothetical protein